MRSFLTTLVSFSQVAREGVYVSITVTCYSMSGIVRFTYGSCVFELLAPGGLYKYSGDSGFQAVSDNRHYEAKLYLVD